MVRIRQLTRKRYVKPRPFVLLLLLLIFHNNSIKPLNIKKNITARISERKKTRFSTWIPSSRSGISLQSNIPVDILQIGDISSPVCKLPSENRLALSSMLHRARMFVPSHARDLPRSSHEHPRFRARLVLLFRPLPQTESLELEQANQFYTNQGACSALCLFQTNRNIANELAGKKHWITDIRAKKAHWNFTYRNTSKSLWGRKRKQCHYVKIVMSWLRICCFHLKCKETESKQH